MLAEWITIELNERRGNDVQLHSSKMAYIYIYIYMRIYGLCVTQINHK